MAADIGASVAETFTYGSPRTTVTAGKTITGGSSVDVVFYTANGDTVSSVADSNGNSYASVTSVVETTNGNKIWLYRKENATGGNNTTWTVTMTSGGVVLIAAYELTGVPSSSIADGTPVTVMDTSSPFSNSFTTTAGGLVVTVLGVLDGGGSSTFTLNGGFTKFLENTSTWKIAVGKVTPAAATTAYDPAATQSSNTYAALITYGVKAGGATAYTLACAQGTYGVTGSAAAVDLGMNAAQGSYGIAGQNVTLNFSGQVATPVSVGGGGRKGRNVPEFVTYEEPEKAPDLSEFEVPKKVAKAVKRVLDKEPENTEAAVRMLRNELGRLSVPYRPEYRMLVKPAFDPVAYQQQQDEDDVEVILLSLFG